ncbi:ap2 domain containing protein [Hordeum vulgare]|nr:ap2 domain containing protein [Hordeum vulgare]
MCGGAILANLTPERVRRRLTEAQLWADVYFPVERAVSGRRSRRRAAATTGDDFEAEFQVFEEEDDDIDDDYEAPPAAASTTVALGSSRRRIAGAKSTNYIRVRRRPSGRRAAEDTRQRRRVWLDTYGGDAEEAAPAYDREARRVRRKSARLDDSPNEGCPRRRDLPGTIDLNQPPAVSGDHMVSADTDACKANIMQLIEEGSRDGRMAGLASENSALTV